MSDFDEKTLKIAKIFLEKPQKRSSRSQAMKKFGHKKAYWSSKRFTEAGETHDLAECARPGGGFRRGSD